MISFYSFLLSKKYPQYNWASDIAELISEYEIDESIDQFYDVPGGAGFISSNLAKVFDKKFYVYDIDDTKIASGKKLLGTEKIQIENKDLYKTTFKPKSLWLLINSLYLLPNIESVIAANKKNTPYIIGVFPYTDSKNYLHFKTKIDPNLNSNEMTKAQTLDFFRVNDYELVGSRDTTYFNYLLLSNIPLAKHIAAILFTFLEKCLKLKGKLYWVGVFKRVNN